MTDRELLELIAAQVGSLTTQVEKIDSRLTRVEAELTEVKAELTEVKTELTEVKADVQFTKETVVKIEHDHGKKLKALFDGYYLHSEKLDRIEQAVNKHEELIIKKLK